MYPKFEEGLTVAECMSLDCYRKKPSLLFYDAGMKEGLAQLLLREARVGEILRRNPHPNIAQYFGCEVENGRVLALCWQKYKCTLRDMAREPVEKKIAMYWLEGIRRGMLHVHAQGLCHNDINPTNVMITEDNTAVLIDFDTCLPHGEPLGEKHGTEGWSNNSAKLSEPSNDMYSFDLVRDFILEKVIN